MAGYTVTIEAGQIHVHVYGNVTADDAYVDACNKIREALKDLKGIQIFPNYSKPVKIERHREPDPRD